MKKLSPAPLVTLLFALILQGCLGGTASFDNTADIEYLEKNAQRGSVTVTSSGLQFEILEEGEGEQPGPAALVRFHYEGWLVNDIIFYSTRGGEPAEFFVDEVVMVGFAEGLQMMRAGGSYQLVIPAELAYGDLQVGYVHPGATLIFEVHLLEVDNDAEKEADNS